MIPDASGRRAVRAMARATVRATMTAMARSPVPAHASSRWHPPGPSRSSLVASASPPTARRRTSRRPLATLLLGWTFEPLPTLAILVAIGLWTWAVRRVDRAHPANPVPRRRSVDLRAGDAGPRLRAPVGHRALRHDAVLGPHGPAPPAGPGRGPAHRPGRADHAAPPGRVAGRRVAAGSCRSCTRGSCACWPSRSWPGSLFAGVMWVEPLLAAVRRGARGPVRPHARARPVPGDRAAVLVAGRRRGPGAVADAPPGPGAVRVPADAPEHVPRRRHPRRRRRSCTRTTRRSRDLGSRRRWRTSSWPPGSCGWSAT